MKKPRKQSNEPVGWAVYLIRSKPQWVGSVEARDETEARERAIKQLDIRPADRFRISVVRRWCREHLGMSPLRLRMRRMHLARRALTRADPTATTVMTVAMALGLLELGRFSVECRALFGERPSDTLCRIAAPLPKGAARC